ncbi:hypothetical protein EV44_g2552 [Erysiphe necator]|uniref:Uncharacterized protein n=1 Tax=Uncinula necator TaxID=52586 RepID=A0A0B1P2P3_UNCNE|nr:hypothetical protein EV44_g2552 [Erysiphe necator]
MSSSWFPHGRNTESGWKLDIVSLLAVIGESSMDSHIQVLTSSWYCILPRIIPAPQALLKPTRPTRLPQINAAVVGVHSGTFVPTLNYFPEILHPIDDLPAFSFKVLQITHKERQPNPERDFVQAESRGNHETDRILEGSTIDPRTLENRNKIPSRRSTLRNLKRIMTGQDGRPRIPARKISPLNVVTVLTFLWTCALIIWASFLHDGTAILALITISMVSSVVGFASWWQPVLMNRPSKSKVPDGDVVIRTREGAFLLVKCNEDVARELYTGTEECLYYVTTEGYRTLVGFGTVLLMISVVLLGNCGITMQAAIGISYMVLNGIFWAASLLNPTSFWDLSYYQVEDITPKDSRDAHERTVISTDFGGITETQEQLPSFTRTMWYAIRETKKIGWVKTSGAAPRTPEWDEWLRLAEQHANQGNRGWSAVKMRGYIVEKGIKATDITRVASPMHTQDYSTAATREQIPAFEVPPHGSY